MIISFTLFFIFIYCTIAKNSNLNPLSKQLHLLDQCLASESKHLKLVLKDNKEYKNLNYQYNSRNPVEPPGFFVPETVNDVKLIVKCAKSSGVSLVAKGGGHSYEKFSFGRGNQVVVDFRKFNEVKVDKETKTAVIGSGGLLGNIYYELEKQGGFSVPAGSCPTVGIGGHTLGGGYGLSSRKHGLLVDALLEVGIVTADGEYKIANEDENSDLFWALRGGALISFGMVTHFKFQLFQPPKKLAIIEYFYEPKFMNAAFNSFQNWAANDPDESITAVLFANKNELVLRAVIQTDDKLINQTIFNGLNQYFPQTNVRKKFQTMSYLEMVVHFGNLPIKPSDLATVKRTDHRQLYFHAKSGYVDRLLNNPEIDRFIKALKDAPSSHYMLLDLQGGMINNVAREDTAFVHRQNALYSLQIVNEDDSATNGDKFEYYADEWFDHLSGILSEESYQNYVDSRDFSFKKYYAENLEKLLEVKQKYDPDHFFKLETTIKK